MISQADISATKSKRLIRNVGKKVWISFGVFMAVMIGGTFAAYWYNSLQTYHLTTVQPGVLYRDGNRDLREFKHAITFTGAKTVVSLIDDKELTDPAKPQFLQETNFCTARQMQYIRIPVPLGGWPKSEDLKTFIAIVSNPVNQPVLVHCAQGVRRTGMFVAAYQMSVMGQSGNQAASEVLSFGHKEEDLNDVRTFIKEYDPQKQTVSGDHVPSKE